MLTLFGLLQIILVTSGVTGLGFGQTANVLIVYPPAPAMQTEVSCTIAVDYFDANSNPVETTTFTLNPGQSRDVTLTRSQLGASAHVPLHPLFWYLAGVTSCGPSDPECMNDDDCENLDLVAYDTDSLGNDVLRLVSVSNGATGAAPPPD
jgi:hypothetical protein